MPDSRPTPEILLERALQEEVQHRGKLKIYLGAAPGVGKTYKMLEDAHAKRALGLDVVAGVVESHQRKEIEELLKNIEILPKREVEYHSKPLTEFDLDAALNRNPGLILIDEMAHTNIPGLRHAKRWQDIKELLDRGIDVYTTLNVQHVESLNDDISKIIGVKIRETVPDSLLESADTVEVVDLSPDDLLKRLQDGKVYIPAQAELATQHFFRKLNLTALRELALRVTADRVDAQVLQQRRGQGIVHTWPTKERILVCIGSTPASAKIIRATRRMSSSLHAAWIVIHVESPQMNLSDEQRATAVQNLRLAEQLGAETQILSGVDVVEEIMRFARDKNVTKIVIGKHVRPRWRDLLLGSLVDALVRESGDIDIYIIRGDALGTKLLKPSVTVKSKIPWKYYGFSLITLMCATLVNLLLFPNLALSNTLVIYLFGVMIVALCGYIGPALFASFLSTLLFVYFFIPPYYQFVPANMEYFFMMVGVMAFAYIVSHLTNINRQQSDIAHTSQQRTYSLHVLTRQLSSTRGIDKLLEIATNYLSIEFESDILILLSENKRLVVRAASTLKKDMAEKDQGVAQWVYDMGQTAGIGTNTLPFSDSVYVPLLGSQGPIGVLRLHPQSAERFLIPEQLRLLESCSHQIALALEVDHLQEKAKTTQIAIETERLRAALFSSLSNELRSPLAAIVKLINRFIKKKSELAEGQSQALFQNIAHEAQSLTRLMNNLLQITQLEEGKIQLHTSPHSLEALIKTTLSRVEKQLGDKPYTVSLPSNLPLIPFDTVLMEQVFVNLIENAILYTPSETPIEIAVSLEDDGVLISVADRGPGLMMNDIDMVFEKFYRGQTSKQESGAGLGLAVCQSIMKAHGGRIWVENRWGGGALFYFKLPLKGSA